MSAGREVITCLDSTSGLPLSKVACYYRRTFFHALPACASLLGCYRHCRELVTYEDRKPSTSSLHGTPSPGLLGSLDLYFRRSRQSLWQSAQVDRSLVRRGCQALFLLALECPD
jgi:hypothetical protein